VLEEALPPASVLQRLLDVPDDSPDHDLVLCLFLTMGV
jgi:hypothetical protein